MFGKRKFRKQSNLQNVLGESPSDKKLAKTLTDWFSARYDIVLSNQRLNEFVDSFTEETPLRVGEWDDERAVYVQLRKETRRNSDSHYLYYLIGDPQKDEWLSAPILEAEDLNHFGVASHQLNAIRFLLREEYFDEVMVPKIKAGKAPKLQVLSVEELEIQPELIDIDLYAEPVNGIATTGPVLSKEQTDNQVADTAPVDIITDEEPFVSHSSELPTDLGYSLDESEIDGITQLELEDPDASDESSK